MGAIEKGKRVDVLFLHTPKSSSHYPPYGEYMTINLLPMGTWGVADLVTSRGYGVEIVHLGLEWIIGGSSDPGDHLQGKRVRLVAIPLHWHQQSYDVMEAAAAIKKKGNPFIVLGGYTASFFAKEILEGFPQVDAVIRGDAEVPLLALLEALEGGRAWQEVPNLTWRDKGGIKETPLSYVAGEKDLEGGSYANLRLLSGWDTYIQSMGIPFIWAKVLSPEENRKRFHLGPPIFPLNIGRGCLGECTWCGGGAQAQYLINGRRGVVFRQPERVVETMAEAQDWGYEMVHIAFDPGKEGERYYLELFPLVRRKGIRMKCYFESFSLPSRRLLTEFQKTFALDGSVISLSPECGDEGVRYRHKTFAYTNEELLATIAAAQERNIRVDVFFTLGIPGEGYADLAKTASLHREIQRRFKNIGRIWTSTIPLEPASPWHREPEAFGVRTTRRTFIDFYQGSAPGGGGLGYYIPDYLGEGRELTPQQFEGLLLKAKCRDHCSLHPNPARASTPFWGRLYCRYLRWRRRYLSG